MLKMRPWKDKNQKIKENKKMVWNQGWGIWSIHVNFWISVFLPTRSSNIDSSSSPCALPLGAALKPTACPWWSTKWTKGFPMSSSFPFETITNGRGTPTRGLIHLKSHPRCRVPWPRGWMLGKETGRCLHQKEPPTFLAASPVTGAPWRGGECAFQGLPRLCPWFKLHQTP